MRLFSSRYAITNTGPVLKRPLISVGDDGTVIEIEDTGGDIQERHSVYFHNGIIIPGFVNCHCHLELSHMKDTIVHGSGLTGFIESIRNNRSAGDDRIMAAAEDADQEMYNTGVNLCADICNTPLTFDLKKKSRISYISLLEVFGIDPQKAERRMGEIKSLAETAAVTGIPFSVVPHSVYSLSLPLFRLLRKISNENTITSIHFMETRGETELIRKHSGPLMNSYVKSGLISSGIETVKSHIDAVLNEITLNGNLILVHNTCADRQTIRKIKTRGNLFWCLCPRSNMYIEKRVPPVNLLLDEDCMITIGTDSLASNNNINILEEIKLLQSHFPALTIPELILWATLNGAKALQMEEAFGKIEKGKKPGLLLLENVDMQNMKLLPESSVTRLT